ncbi:MAG: endolytic transglycosylase MltG, partial [Muribaculaceae bacterium]|nr:endolytic transglycosylase MltG [Muribaculaceae bacterium]
MPEIQTKRKPSSRQATSRPRPRKKPSSSSRRVNPITWMFICLGVVAVGVVLWFIGLDGHRGDAVRVTVPREATEAQVRDSLDVHLGRSMGKRVYLLWKLMGGNPAKARGSYLVTRGEMALRIAHNLSRGRQTPVNVTFNNIRTMPQLADRMAGLLDFSSEEFLDACRQVLPGLGFSDEAQYPAAFLPDSYEVYWTTSPEALVEKLAAHRNRFWTDERRARARALGLTPVQVATV